MLQECAERKVDSKQTSTLALGGASCGSDAQIIDGMEY